MAKKSGKLLGVFFDPMAERMGRRTHVEPRTREFREAAFRGARAGTGAQPGGGIAIAILALLYLVWIIFHAVVTESWRTLRGNPRFGKKRNKNRHRPSNKKRVRTVFHEV